MKKLLLIEPAVKTKYRTGQIRFFEKIANNDYFKKPSLALGVIAGLTPPDWEIQIVQGHADAINYNERPDLVAITAVTNTVNRGYEIADEFRKRGIKVIMGGIHPTVLPQEALQHCDSVCVGEAEPVWEEVIHDLERGQLKAIYKADSLFDMAKYTSPRRDLMTKPKSSLFNPGVFIEASRGCPYNCDFCSVSLIHGRKIRYRPTGELIREIERVRGRKLFFVDNNIVANVRKAKELFKALIPLKLNWTGQASISIAKDPELLKLAAQSGCRGLLIGVESVIDDGLHKYPKNPENFNELAKALKRIKDHGIKALAQMVFGNDYETSQTLSESLRRLSQLDIVSASIGIVIPYPGTQLAKNLGQQGRLLHNNWDLYNINNLVFQPANFSCTDFIKEIEELRKKYFSYKAILSRTTRFHSLEVLGFNISMKAHNKVHFKQMDEPN